MADDKNSAGAERETAASSARERPLEETPAYRERVYEIVRRIPTGRVMTYGQIAEILGEGYTPRTVGFVMHAADVENTPWHRVINSQGSCSTQHIILPHNKQQLMLEAEGVEFNARARCDLSRYRWTPDEAEGESKEEAQGSLFGDWTRVSARGDERMENEKVVRAPYEVSAPRYSVAHHMVTTAFELHGFNVTQHLGVVRGIVVRSRNLFVNIGAAFQSMVGGNITAWTKLCEQTRSDAFEIMIQHATELGANAIIGARYDTTEIASGVTEVLAYGTAVIVEPIDQASYRS